MQIKYGNQYDNSFKNSLKIKMNWKNKYKQTKKHPFSNIYEKKKCNSIKVLFPSSFSNEPIKSVADMAYAVYTVCQNYTTI